MPTSMAIELEGGKTIYFGGSTSAGLSDVGFAEDVTQAGKDAFESALGALAGLVGSLNKAVDALPNKPNKVEVEFAVSLSGRCDLVVVKGDGKADFKVQLAWD